jgi:hypothetical protein
MRYINIVALKTLSTICILLICLKNVQGKAVI